HPADDFVRQFIGKKRINQADEGDARPNLPTVDDVITEQPVTISPGRGLAEAISIMEKRQVDMLLVIGQGNKLLGNVSIYQLLEHFGDERKKVSDVMKPVRHVIKTGRSLSMALNMMSRHNLSNLPVVKKDNEFVGLITRGSVVHKLADVYVPASEEVDAG